MNKILLQLGHEPPPPTLASTAIDTIKLKIKEFFRNAANASASLSREDMRALGDYAASKCKELYADNPDVEIKFKALITRFVDNLSTLSSAQFAEALGYRIVDCGGSGNNCMILSALTARDRRNGTNPPAGGYREEAEQLRQKILAEIDKDLQAHVSDLKSCLANIGMSEEEIAAIIEQAKSLTKRGANKELDKAEVAQLRTQVIPKIASWLKMGEESDAVSGEYNAITETMGRIGDLSFLKNSSTAGKHLYTEAVRYIARIFECDVAVVNLGRDFVYTFRADGTHAEDLEGKLAENVVEMWKIEHGIEARSEAGYLGSPIILTCEGNDESGHYEAFVPKA